MSYEEEDTCVSYLQLVLILLHLVLPRKILLVLGVVGGLLRLDVVLERHQVVLRHLVLELGFSYPCSGAASGCCAPTARLAMLWFYKDE